MATVSIQNRLVLMTAETLSLSGASSRFDSVAHCLSTVNQCRGSVTTRSTPAKTTRLARQPHTPSSAVVIGANTVDERPPARVKTVSAPYRLAPYRRVTTANAA